MKAAAVGLFFAIASIWFPLPAVEPAARIVVPAIALLATGIFPCMTLTIGAMKGDHRSPLQVDELYGQLKFVMKVLVATFALAAALAATMVAIIAIDAGAHPRWSGVATRLLLALACIELALLGGRIHAVGRAFFAILDINRKHALLVARAKVQGERDKTMDALRKQRFAPDDPTPRPLQKV
ncbi:hypothetical protein [Sphingomonas sp.]|uniref:hypothetical protein n=1 Tax=Sphingomonas sp. TaxID=28214 RepID=UPI003BAC7C83